MLKHITRRIAYSVRFSSRVWKFLSTHAVILEPLLWPLISNWVETWTKNLAYDISNSACNLFTKFCVLRSDGVNDKSVVSSRNIT